MVQEDPGSACQPRLKRTPRAEEQLKPGATTAEAQEPQSLRPHVARHVQSSCPQPGKPPRQAAQRRTHHKQKTSITCSKEDPVQTETQHPFVTSQREMEARERTQMTISFRGSAFSSSPPELWIAFRAPFVSFAVSCLLGCLSVGDPPRQMARFWGLVTGHYWPRAATTSPALGP